MYAIVDIETTGGSPGQHGITEVCAVITDGRQVLQVFETLINPGTRVPAGISALTGITTDMVASAPPFASIAAELHHLLHDKVFVAHNVNFDYSFIKEAFGQLGYGFQPAKLCTVKLSRKAFPGRRSYSLGNICASLGIDNSARHRAGGDALATAELFHRCVNALGSEPVARLAATSVRKITLPPAIDEGLVDRLPETPGVYFFHDKSGKVVYTGKAINIRKRVLQHFDTRRGKTPLQLEQIHHIDFEECGNELVALLTEAEAIHRHWPAWNVSGKSFGHKYSLVHYQSQSGHWRIQTEKRRKGSGYGQPYPRLSDARNALGKLISEHGLCPVLIRSSGTCYVPDCYCKEEEETALDTHNRLVAEAMESLEARQEECLISGPGRKPGENAFVLVRDGAVVGWGFADEEVGLLEPDMLIKPRPDLPETRIIARSFLRKLENGRHGPYRLLKTEETIK